MSYNLSGCVFIRNAFQGAFCLFESMHQLLPLCDEFIVMDLGSDDGTLEILQKIEKRNPKVALVQSTFYEQDAAIFAKLANDLIGMCNYDTVLYYQSDEIWHENLVELTRGELYKGSRNLSFWRVQLKNNFQKIKWFPHPVHRIAPKEKFNFVNDGMNTDTTYDAEVVSELGHIVKLSSGPELKRFNIEDLAMARAYMDLLKKDGIETNVSLEKLWGAGMFLQWGDRYKHAPENLPLDQMILDVSLTGGFLDNIPDRRRMHLPFWNEGDVMPADEEGMRIDAWYRMSKEMPEWYATSTNFNIPQIMRYHLGKQKYELRESLLEALYTL